MNCSRLLSTFLAAVTGAAVLVVPAVVGAAPAGAVVQPCTVTYPIPGGAIRAEHDAGKNHSLLWLTAKVDDARIVTDIDITADLTHPDAGRLSLHLLSPQTNASLVPTIQAVNTGMASGRVQGQYTFDEDTGAAPLAGANPAPTTYGTATPEKVLEGHPATGTWSLWLSNYGSLPGEVRSASLTLTYATCDTDGDGVEDKADNCPTAVNADQSNRDDDALGDACDLDIDGDALANTDDGCPLVATTTTSGCPSVGRTASLRYAKATRKLKVVVRSDVPACESQAKVTLFRTRPGKDTKLVVASTNGKGRKTWKAPARSGRYYVRVAASYATGQAECGHARSSRARVPHGRTALRVVLVDTDGDGLDDAVDGCPTVASANPTGCPSASRSVSLKWLAGKQRLQVQVSSPVAGCSQRARIALFRVRASQDVKVFGGSVSFGGRLRIKVARGATYYVTVPQSYASGVAECGTAESRRVLAPRG